MDPAFEAYLERQTGMSIDELRRTPVDELRKDIEKRLGHSIPTTPFDRYGNRVQTPEEAKAEIHETSRILGDIVERHKREDERGYREGEERGLRR